MIPYQLPQEKQTLLHYAELLNDSTAKKIIEQDSLTSQEEAEYFARFFWQTAHASNDEDKRTGESSDYILEKIIISLMAYYRSSGFESVWERVADEN